MFYISMYFKGHVQQIRWEIDRSFNLKLNTTRLSSLIANYFVIPGYSF